MPRFLNTYFTQGVRFFGWCTQWCLRGVIRSIQFTAVVLRASGARAWQYPRTTGLALGLVVTGVACQVFFSGALFPEPADVGSHDAQSSDELTGMDGQLLSVLPDVEPAKLETDFPMTALVPNTVSPPTMPDFEPILPVASLGTGEATNQPTSQNHDVPVATGSQFGTPPWSESTIPEYRPTTDRSIADHSNPSSKQTGSGAWLTGTIESVTPTSQPTSPTRMAGPWGNSQTPQRY